MYLEQRLSPDKAESVAVMTASVFFFFFLVLSESDDDLIHLGARLRDVGLVE